MSIDYGAKAISVVPLDLHRKSQQSTEQGSEAAELFQGLTSKMPPMPAELGQIAKNHWYFIGKQLESAGLITQVDLSVLRVYCETYEHYVYAQRDCAAKGEYQKTPNNYEQLAPWAVARERHASRLDKLENRLFLNPRARQSIKLENPNQGQLDL